MNALSLISIMDVKNNIGSIFINAISALYVTSFFEEILFRGYIGKRFFLHDKYTSLIIVAILFTSMHIPFRVIIYNMDIFRMLYVYMFSLLFDFVFHIFMQIFYNKFNNCIGPVIFHFTIVFSGWLISNLVYLLSRL